MKPTVLWGPMGAFYYAEPEVTRVTFHVFVLLKKLKMKSCQRTYFAADDGSFLAVLDV